MASTTAPAAAVARPARAGFAGALRSEITKIRSVRSTYWTLLAMVLVTVGLGALFGWGTASNWSRMSAADRASFDPTATSLAGLIIGQLIIVVLGSLTITSEYSSGMVRTSLTALPRRGTVYAAKAVVFTLVALITGMVTSFASFALGQAALSSQHINAALSQPHVLRAVVGGGLFVAACGLLAFGIGAIVRHTAAAITASTGLLFVLFILGNFLPGSWSGVRKWIPFDAGSQVFSVRSSPHMFTAWSGFAVFCTYAAVALVAGLILFRRRDA